MAMASVTLAAASSDGADVDPVVSKAVATAAGGPFLVAAMLCGVPDGGGSPEGLVCHHIVRPQDGGTDESSNLTTLCRRCHGNAHLKRREDRRINSLEGATGRPTPVFREGQREKA